jgi:diguanylate cyclase (GGDEF)-like protein/PAS domain S-box-containing protein
LEPEVERQQSVDDMVNHYHLDMPAVAPTLQDGEPTFRTIIENSSDIIARFDLNLHFLYINQSATRFFPLLPCLYIGKTMPQAGWPESWSRPIEHALQDILLHWTPVEIEIETERPEEYRVFESRLMPEFSADGTLASILFIAREITEASQARRLLTEENAVLEMIADSLPINQILHCICKMIEAQLSSGMCSIMRLDSGGETLSLAAAPTLPADYCQMISGVSLDNNIGPCTSASFWKRSIIVSDIEASPLWSSLHEAAAHFGLKACWSTPIFTSDHQFLGTLAIYYTVTRSPSASELRLIYRCSHIAAIALQRNLHEAQLYLLATEDGLTHLFNRRHFIEISERHLTQAKRYQQPVSVLMLDLDHFKLVNDHYGHAVGDKILSMFSQICRNCLRTSDIIGRMGGEEFAALLPGTGLIEARHVAERLRQQVDLAELIDQGLSIRFQVSIGVSTLLDKENLDNLLVRADRQLYRAKVQGRNLVCAETLPESALQHAQSETTS